MIADLKAYKRDWMRKDRLANPEKYKERCRQWNLNHDSVYYGAEYYKKYHPRMYAKRKERAALIQGLKNKPCADCHDTFPTCCMQFDHRDPSTKSVEVSRLRSSSVKRILEEAAKCDVVCANCHFIRTHKQKESQYGKWMLGSGL